jgi:hypothetical protein
MPWHSNNNTEKSVHFWKTTSPVPKYHLSLNDHTLKTIKEFNPGVVFTVHYEDIPQINIDNRLEQVILY